MDEIGFFERLMSEASNMDLKNFIFVALLFYIPFHFSKKAETLFFHLLYSFFGLYMLFTMKDTRVIYDFKMLVGLGLLVPQIKFIIQFAKDTIQTTKMMTANTYYFFVTIYYKIIRFINWIKSTYIMLKTFFTTFSFKKEDYYEQEQNSQQNYSYERKHQKFYEEPKQKEQSNTKQETPKNHGKSGRFYNDSAYIVLGVNENDDFETIKKAYRKLVREYHPDLNQNNIKKATEITQLINSAYEKLEKYKK